VVDWAALLAELRRHGFTYGQLPSLVHISKTQIIEYANNNACPTFDAGERLIELWLGVTNAPRSAIPRMPRRLSAANLR
jgi:predicted transcriptional regulator